MAVTSPETVFVLTGSAPAPVALRGTALTADLKVAAGVDGSVGSFGPSMCVAVSATLAATAVASNRRRGQKMARNFFGGGSSSSYAPAFDPSKELGVQDPVGFWDPLGLSADKNEATFRRRRQTELKHGRIAMLATMGYITPEITGKLPGYLDPNSGLKFEDIPNGLAAISKVPALGWAQILAYMSYCEISQDQSPGTKASTGDFGFLTQYYSDTRRNAELANGRLAMMAIIGMFFQDGLTGSAWGDWSLYTASPLRFFGGGGGSSYAPAFDPSKELGVQDPVGFWDPLGLSADKNEATFRRRRQTELKHGRIAMLATMGYITPEITGKLPGYLDPNSGLKFEDIPNGLAAISKVPALGWAQILAYMSYCEISQDQSPGTKASTGDFGFLTQYYSDTRRNAELANGRLAMMAIIGMFFQDGLTGSAWGDWSLYTASPLRAFGSSRDASARRSVTARNAESIASTAIANGNFKTLVAALTKANLVSTVEGGTFTVFAPTDAAFAALLKELNVTADGLLANPDLKNILLYHVVSGSAMSSSLKDGQQLSTVQGGKLAVKISGGVVTVGGSKVTTADVACTNGVIHVIDKVLLPPASASGKFSPAKQVGVTDPLGFFDPLGFCKEGDEAGFRNLRASEIKHGRVAMMAALGAVAQHFMVGSTAPGMPAGLSAVTTAPASYGFAALFLASGALEFTLFSQKDDKEPGNFGDPVGFGDYSVDSRNRELNNGRFAMFSAIGIIAAELLTGKDAVQQFGF